MKRLYQQIIEEHINELDQMVFMPGPRQVGKTTIAKNICSHHVDSLYLNWDFLKDREMILSGADSIIEKTKKIELGKNDRPIIVFDEIHKYKRWKNYLKGFFDYSKGQITTLVTGSAKLDVFKKGGDSLMGRYFLYRIHPLSVGELLNRSYDAKKIHAPQKIEDDLWKALFQFGGFPEPFLKQNQRFLNRWQRLRLQQLFYEDIKDLTGVSQTAQMEVLAELIIQQATSQINYHNIAKLTQITDKTAKQWLSVLQSFYFCFTLKPWSKNISRSLIKEPKVFLWDWSLIEDKGKRIENFIASHLLKAVHYWTDIGLGQYDLFYLRDKDKHEVDFLITQNKQPWIMLEVKSSNNQSISPHLFHFQKQIQAEHVFQVVFDLPYVDEDCFSVKKPVIVPAKTFLSQLV